MDAGIYYMCEYTYDEADDAMLWHFILLDENLIGVATLATVGGVRLQYLGDQSSPFL